MSEDLKTLFEEPKKLAVPARWLDVDPEGFEVHVPLEIKGVIIEGLALRATCQRWCADRNVMFQLEYAPAGAKSKPLARIDWKPHHTHNKKDRGPEDLQFKRQKDSHHHSFGLNWLLPEARIRSGNLPIAMPIVPEPESFKNLLALVDKEFRIPGLLNDFPEPPWEYRLL